MGASTDFRKYDKKLSKEQVEKLFRADQEQSAFDSGHSYSGEIGVMPFGIDWKNLPNIKTLGEAYTYISDNHEKWKMAFGIITPEGYVIGGWCSS